MLASPATEQEKAAVAGASDGSDPDKPPLPAYRLTSTQREKLAGYRQLDEHSLRRQAGVTIETVDAAIAGGRDLAPEIVGRLVGFLEQQQPAAE
jgi:hypothetical protein